MNLNSLPVAVVDLKHVALMLSFGSIFAGGSVLWSQFGQSHLEFAVFWLFWAFVLSQFIDFCAENTICLCWLYALQDCLDCWIRRQTSLCCCPFGLPWSLVLFVSRHMGSLVTETHHEEQMVSVSQAHSDLLAVRLISTSSFVLLIVRSSFWIGQRLVKFASLKALRACLRSYQVNQLSDKPPYLTSWCSQHSISPRFLSLPEELLSSHQYWPETEQCVHLASWAMAHQP